jgi:hypothetical protein
MSIFQGANEAKMTRQVRNVVDFPGTHVCKIIAVKQGVTFQTKAPWFGADLQIVSTSCADLPDGVVVAWSTQKHPTWPQYFFSDVKQFIAAAAKQSVDEVTEEVMEAAVSDDQPMAEMLIGIRVVRAFNGKTKQPKVNREGQPVYTTQFFVAQTAE